MVRFSRRRATFALASATVAMVLAGGATSAPGTGGSGGGPKPPTPLPVDSSGLPVAIEQALDTIGPGQDVLVAVKPAGSRYWYRPSDVGATVVDGEVVSIPDAPGRGQATPYAAERAGFGCNAVTRYPPFFSDASHIQGFEDLTQCSNLSTTTASVRLKESRTYGQHAGRITPHAGNADWTAYSQEFLCETQYHRSWQTLATNVYTSTSGATLSFVGASAWEGGYNC